MDARERWNERYRGATLVALPDEPPPWLAEHRELLGGGGRALDVACGDGRAARFLAELGHDVLAVDVSDVVVDAVNRAAGERGLAIAARALDLEREPLPPGPFDVVVALNFLQRDLADALQDALAPGGLLFLETFGAAHVEELGRTCNPAYVLERDELLHAFERLDVVAHRDGVVEREGGPRGLASLVARRPAAER